MSLQSSIQLPTSVNVKTSIYLRLTILFLGLIFAILIKFAYENYDSALYSYQGMTIRSIDNVYLWISLLLSVLPLLILPIDFRRPSDYASWVLYLIVIAPMPLLVMHMSTWSVLDSLSIGTSVVASFLIFEFVRGRCKWKLVAKAHLPNVAYSYLYQIALSIGVLYIWSLVDFQLRLSLDDVYDRRLESRDIATSESLLAYLVSFINGAGIPIVSVVLLRERKPFALVVLIFSLVVSFSFSGAKAALMIPLLIASAYALTKTKDGKHSVYLLLAVCTLILASILEQVVLGSNNISAYLIHRLMEQPAQLLTYYWEFFSANSFVYMTNSVFNVFMQPVYNTSTPLLIGSVYFRDTTNANANIWASAFADFGYVGILVVSIVAALLLSFIDSFSSDHRYSIACGICAMIGLVWSQGAIQTSMLSNALLFDTVFLYLLPPPEEPHHDKSTSGIR